jgi:hypothetical protein
MYAQVACRAVIQNSYVSAASLNMQKLRLTFHSISHLSLIDSVGIKTFKQLESNKREEED